MKYKDFFTHIINMGNQNFDFNHMLLLIHLNSTVISYQRSSRRRPRSDIPKLRTETVNDPSSGTRSVNWGHTKYFK